MIMALVLAFLVVFLAMTGHSDAAYCICKDGVSTDLLQKNIDYACGQGADCSQILQSGSCYNPNTVKDHCNYAVNSYYQKKSPSGATCDFSGTAMISQNIPNAASGCNYPSSPSTAGTVTPITNPSPPGSTTTPISTPTGGTFTPGFGGLGPTGSGISPDNSANGGARECQSPGLFVSLAFLLLVFRV